MLFHKVILNRVEEPFVKEISSALGLVAVVFIEPLDIISNCLDNVRVSV